jgi:murein L,D-transpeptidase YcbB/YkuD
VLSLGAVLTGCIGGPSSDEIARPIAKLRSASRVGGERLVEPAAVSRFYKGRRSRPAWLGHAPEIVTVIRGTEADGLDPADYHLQAIESLLEKRRSERTAASEATLDVLLSDAVAGIADHVHYGRVRPSRVNPEWTADPRDDAPPLDSTLAVIAKSGSVRSSIEAQRPTHFIYRGLVAELARLRGIHANGGWPAVAAAGKPLKPGAVDRRVAQVRRRLIAGGDLEGGVPRDSTRYDGKLAKAVETFQARHRLDPTGVVDGATVEAMNVSVGARIGQLRVNLERARWVLGGLDPDFMLVNLPAFKAYLIRGDKNVWESRTQIGEEAMQTPTFRAKIRTVVFNPDWTVPPTIIEKEIMEDMRSGKNVIDEKGLVITDRENHVVDPGSIDWGSADPAEFPYTIRQPAGDDNALGKVKFLFPNKYSIYLHDTPSRHLFEADRRTFSHGCIRLENPIELAELLLQGQDSWDRVKIERTIASDSTLNVGLDHPLPILIVYWTASVGASGEVRYAEDIYHLDPPLLAAMDALRAEAPHGRIKS